MKFTVRDMTFIGLFVALMVVGAFLKVPNPFFPAVPLTFQLFFCIYAGLLLGAKNAFFSQLVYVLLGLAGLPIFASGQGIGYVLHPTFGFIIGFLVAATAIALLIGDSKKVSFVKMASVALIGFILIYAIGILYMYFVLDLYVGTDVSVIGITGSMVPYMIKDLVLVVIAALTSVKIIPAIRNAGY